MQALTFLGDQTNLHDIKHSLPSKGVPSFLESALAASTAVL